MKYVASHTSIPVLKVLGSGTCAVGPYMVMEFVEGKTLSGYLKNPSESTRLTILDPNVGTSTLRKAYHEMARIILALYQCKFPRIGSVSLHESGAWSVSDRRAVTWNMNELVSLGNYPPKDLPQHSFSTASDYFVALAEEHMRHLKSQRNDAIIDEADCRKRFIARALFLKIARKFSSIYSNGPFPLYCDDFRPSNVIVGADLNIRAVINWEFCYPAPAEFAHCPP